MSVVILIIILTLYAYVSGEDHVNLTFTSFTSQDNAFSLVGDSIISRGKSCLIQKEPTT